MQLTKANKIKVDFIVRKTGCDQLTARNYLEAEEWSTEDALISMRGDLLFGGAKRVA